MKYGIFREWFSFYRVRGEIEEWIRDSAVELDSPKSDGLVRTIKVRIIRIRCFSL